MSDFQTQSARSFFDFTDATAAVLDLLEKHLPDCAVFVAYHDAEAQLLRIVDFRGEPTFGIANGQTMELLPNVAASSEQVDPAPSILANDSVRDIASFVGIPLELRDGTHFGTLCAIARAAERFIRADIELLTVLGRVIVNELDRELTHQALQQRNEDLTKHNRRLRVDAFTDALTGVANRRGFERALAREWKLSKRGTVESYLVLIDLDDFKAVNDRFGHAAGDEVLQLCAKALAEAGRETDVIGRIGGDEFAAILVGCSNGDEAQVFQDRASDLLTELLDEHVANVTFSSGHQSLTGSPSPLRAMDLADQEMYWHKRRRNTQLHGSDLASKIAPSAKGAPRIDLPLKAARIPAKATAGARQRRSSVEAGEASGAPRKSAPITKRKR